MLGFVFGDMPVLWSASLRLAGRLWRRLVVELLFVVLLWMKMEAGKGCITDISIKNKVHVYGGNLCRRRCLS
jgi:hypothetical protein